LPSLDFQDVDVDADSNDTASQASTSTSSVANIGGAQAFDSILPTLGHHYNPSSNVKQAKSTQLPVMAASVLDMLNLQESPSKVRPDGSPSSKNVNSAAPNAKDVNHNESAPNAQDMDETANDIVSTNLSRPTSYTRTSIPHAPGSLQTHLVSSFQSLVNSRVKAWTLLLLRHSLHKGDAESRKRLLCLLASQQDIASASVHMDWSVVERSTMEKEMQYHSAVESWNRQEGKKEGDGGSNVVSGRFLRIVKTQECDLVIPIRMTTTIDMTIQGQIMTVQLTAPGTLAAIYHQGTSQICYLEAKLDTSILVSSMVEQARLVVFEAVARATFFGGKGGSSSGTGSSDATMTSTMAGDLPDGSLMKFGSALTLGPSSSRNPITSIGGGIGGTRPSQMSAGFQSKSQPVSLSRLKAIESARRFSDLLKSKPKAVTTNGSSDSGNPSKNAQTLQQAQRPSQTILQRPSQPILQRPSQVALRMKKQRSVTWTHPESSTNLSKASYSLNRKSKANHSFHNSTNSQNQLNPPTKRRKLMSGSLKRSKISFGKPDANTFSTVRNATFGEFGHLQHANVLDLVWKQNTVGGTATGGQLSYHASTAQLGQQGSALRNSTWSSNRISGFETGQSINDRGGDETQSTLISSHSSLSSGSGGVAGGADGGDVDTTNASYQSHLKPGMSNNTITSILSRNPSQNAPLSGGLKRTPTQLESLLLSASKGDSKRNWKS
jgi:hypothetical protein